MSQIESLKKKSVWENVKWPVLYRPLLPIQNELLNKTLQNLLDYDHLTCKIKSFYVKSLCNYVFQPTFSTSFIFSCGWLLINFSQVHECVMMMCKSEGIQWCITMHQCEFESSDRLKVVNIVLRCFFFIDYLTPSVCDGFLFRFPSLTSQIHKLSGWYLGEKKGFYCVFNFHNADFISAFTYVAENLESIFYAPFLGRVQTERIFLSCFIRIHSFHCSIWKSADFHSVSEFSSDKRIYYTTNPLGFFSPFFCVFWHFSDQTINQKMKVIISSCSFLSLLRRFLWFVATASVSPYTLRCKIIDQYFPELFCYLDNVMFHFINSWHLWSFISNCKKQITGGVSEQNCPIFQINNKLCSLFWIIKTILISSPFEGWTST